MENNNNDKKLQVGKDSVVIGNINGNIGDGSVVIGATDSKGNVILKQSMAIGKNAYASEGSIAIGANAGSGSDLTNLLHQIKLTIDKTGDTSAIEKFYLFNEQLHKENPDRNILKSSWEVLKNFASINGMIGIAERIQHILPILV